LIAYNIKTHKTIEPLPHQQRILEELKMFNKALVHIPSGAGKTHTAAFDVRNKKPKTFLYISHRNEINTQAIKIFKEVCGIEDHDIGQINQTSKQFNRPFLFANIQTISRPKHIRKLNKDIDYVVIDEFHHAAAKTYRKIMKYLQPKILLGLTATPDRMDAQDVRQLLDNNVVGNIDIPEGIKHKILITFHYRGYKDNVDYSDIKFYHYKYRENDLDKKLLIPERDEKVIERYKNDIEPDNRQTIGFCATIKHVVRMVQVFKDAGINAEGITYHDTIAKRRKIIEKFRKGEITVLFSRDILNEGVDFPECEALMFLRPTISETIFLQQLGRGLRKRRGKKPVIVLDFISNYHNAYKIRAYLSKISKKKYDIIQKGRNFKPEYNLSVPTYEFEEEVIEMMELQEIMKNRKRISGNYTRQDLIENYWNIKKKLGYAQEEVPTFNQFLEESRIPSTYYKNLFGGYTKFLKFIGERVNMSKNITKEELIDNYYQMKNKLGRQPHYLDINKKTVSNFSTTPYNDNFGSYNKFLQTIGEPLLRKHKTKRTEKLNDIKKEYFKRKTELGLSKNQIINGTLWKKNYGQRFIATLQHKYRMSWNKFLERIGEKPIRICLLCNKKYVPKISTAKYCSRKCTNRAHKLKIRKKNPIFLTMTTPTPTTRTKKIGQ
jgi:superfamily II DNA or RNA helicase